MAAAPPATLARKKQGFSTPVARWLAVPAPERFEARATWHVLGGRRDLP